MLLLTHLLWPGSPAALLQLLLPGLPSPTGCSNITDAHAENTSYESTCYNPYTNVAIAANPCCSVSLYSASARGTSRQELTGKSRGTAARAALVLSLCSAYVCSCVRPRLQRQPVQLTLRPFKIHHRAARWSCARPCVADMQ